MGNSQSNESSSTFITHICAFADAVTNPNNYKESAKDGFLDFLQDPFQVNGDFALSDTIVQHVNQNNNG
ncbi:hypothetical protein TWF694_005222 [Orbilia ellipsospora]|uniref:Uncharacterized protein n=1 Tax=Orbilia ellipsospora TaxID=2528407 RepID=A0AAV9WUX3_9PEZI